MGCHWRQARNRHWYVTSLLLSTILALMPYSTSAIGHSTNLIGRDSNIIVIRGGNDGRPVYDQLIYAVDEFFPGSGIVDEKGAVKDLDRTTSLPKPVTSRKNSTSRRNSSQSVRPAGGELRRFDTGISSIVGSQNGERPGGFVLVIDGPGLQVVRHPFWFPCMSD